MAIIHQFNSRPLRGFRAFVDGRMATFTGIGTHLLEHARGLEQLGACLTVSACTRADEQAIHAFAPAARIVRVWPSVYSLSERFRSVVVPRSVGEQDAFLFPQYNAPFNVPRQSVVTVHDLIQFRYNLSLKNKLKATFANHVLLRSIERAERVVCPSRSTKHDLLEYLSEAGLSALAYEGKISVVENGVSSRWAQPATAAATAEASRLTRSTPYILCVGNGKPHKNVRLVLEIGSRLADAGFPHRTVFVGKPDAHLGSVLGERDQRQVDRVSAIGHVTDDVLLALYKGADVLLTPSLYEGFGLPPLEAMMAGTPVVASTRGGLPEAVGSGGVLLDPLDGEKWFDTVRRILTDESFRRRAIADGRRWASSLTWRAASIKLANELLAASRRHPLQTSVGDAVQAKAQG